MSSGRCLLTSKCHALPVANRSSVAIPIGSAIGAGGPGWPGRNMRVRRRSSINIVAVYDDNRHDNGGDVSAILTALTREAS